MEYYFIFKFIKYLHHQMTLNFNLRFNFIHELIKIHQMYFCFSHLLIKVLLHYHYLQNLFNVFHYYLIIIILFIIFTEIFNFIVIFKAMEISNFIVIFIFYDFIVIFIFNDFNYSMMVFNFIGFKNSIL